MTPDRECRVCGSPWVRATCAPWCARTARWLASLDTRPSTAAKRAANAARQREYRRRKREAA